MTGPAETVRTRILPALLSAFGVTLLAAGLLTYGEPIPVDPAASPTARPSPNAVGGTSPSPLITLPPIGTATPGLPTAAPTAPADRVATRVRIKALGIDLPVIKGPAGYPPCDVAMYLKELSQPGFGKATYLYAHARTGMFLPLLETKGRAQRGSVVEVWTSDDMVFTYEITEVRRGQTSLDDPLSATSEELWLQTSEGPKGTVGKTQVIATPLVSAPADPAAAHPKARPVAC
jgi:hypothetical protein